MRFAALVLVLAACTEQDSIEPGLLAPNYGKVEAALSVTLDAPLLVHIETFGDGCVMFERTDDDLARDGADVWPYDRFHTPGSNGGCTQILNHYTHDVTLTFHNLGPKTIVVHGSQEVGGKREEYRVELGVTVGCPDATCASLDP